MKTVNRGWLLRKAKAGKLVMVGSYEFDDQFGSQRSKVELPVRVKEEYGDFIEGFCNLWDHDFTSRSGGAYQNDNGTIHLRVHGNCNYDFKLID